MSWHFPSGGQSIGASVLPRNIQGWFLLELSGLICMQSKGLSRIFSSTTIWKHQFFGTQLSSQSNSHPYITTGKTIALTRWTFVGKVMSLLLNMLSRFVIDFLPRSKWKKNERESVSPSVHDSFPPYGYMSPGSSTHRNGSLQTRILEWVAIPRSKCLLISHLQSLSTKVLEPKQTKSVTAFIFPPAICHEVIELELKS